MRKPILALAALILAAQTQAAAVKLTDGSVITGEVTQADGLVKVKNAAGETSIPKDKVSSIVEDGSVGAGGSAAAGEVHSPYIDKVNARRAKYGNEDGLPQSTLVQSDQLQVNIGQLNYTGDAFLVKDLTTGATLVSASDLAGLSYGLIWAHSFTDYVALEMWGDFASASKDFSVNGTSYNIKVQRFDLGIGPKVQKAINLGSPESAVHLIPNIGITPIWSSNTGSTNFGGTTTNFNASSLGASVNAGFDMQFGGALISVKARYLLSSDVSGNLKASNTSAWLPQIGLGWSF